MIPEEESGLMDSGGQIRVEDELQAIEEVEGLSGWEPFNLMGNLEEAKYGFYQTHPEESTYIRKMHFVPGISRDILGWLKVL